MQTYLLIFGTLILTVSGQLLIKWRAQIHTLAADAAGTRWYLAAMLTDPAVWCGLVGAVMAAAFWILAVRHAPLSVAYPFMALSFVLVPAGAALLFGESISGGQYAGIILVILGVTINAASH